MGGEMSYGAMVVGASSQDDNTLVYVHLVNGMSLTARLFGKGGARRIEAPTIAVERRSWQHYNKSAPVPVFKFTSTADKTAFERAVLRALDEREQRTAGSGSLDGLWKANNG